MHGQSGSGSATGRRSPSKINDISSIARTWITKQCLKVRRKAETGIAPRNLSKQLVARPRSRGLAGLRGRRIRDQLLRRSTGRRSLLRGEGAEQVAQSDAVHLHTHGVTLAAPRQSTVRQQATPRTCSSIPTPKIARISSVSCRETTPRIAGRAKVSGAGRKTPPKPPAFRARSDRTPEIPTERCARGRRVPGSSAAAAAAARRGAPASEATARATTRRPWRCGSEARGSVPVGGWLVSGY